MHDYDNQELASASPTTIFDAQRKPSDKALDALKEWRDSETREWDREALDAVIEYLRKEVEN